MTISFEEWIKNWIDQNGTVVRGTCYISLLVVTPKEGKELTVNFYDSQGSTNNLFLQVECSTGQTIVIPFLKPIRCENGLYVYTNEPNDFIGVMIVYKVKPLLLKD